MLEELAAQGRLRRGYKGVVVENLKAAIDELALGNTFFRGLQQVMPPHKSKLYNELYEKVRYFTDTELNTVGRQSVTTRGESTAHKSQPRIETESDDREPDQEHQDPPALRSIQSFGDQSPQKDEHQFGSPPPKYRSVLQFHNEELDKEEQPVHDQQMEIAEKPYPMPQQLQNDFTTVWPNS